MSKPLFHDLIKLMQQVKEPEDISFELIDELNGLTTYLIFQTFINQPNTNISMAIENCKQHFISFYDNLETDMKNNPERLYK